ncbi:hypothetical protein CBR_g31267 [Chara braunii]|uniref:Uncharacterized protein n=1 Tax=Chara braunii TaxID=69332 RepID=A0A388JXT4_CHABU|nr:hypothetical protein CBR_g31267 [Chara braunii]|eukprot:GBG62631.1 hypothetical protein CBR_g31267 [Chara braunii]
MGTSRGTVLYPRHDGLISGTPVGRFGAGLPSHPPPHVVYAPPTQAAYAPSAPPLSQAPVNHQQGGMLSTPSTPVNTSTLVPYQPPTAPSTSVAPWGPRQGSNDGEVVSLLRELVNDRREQKDRRREAENRLMREEQDRMAKEEEKKRLLEEESRQAEKEARMARMINAKMEELDRQHQARTEEENKRMWKEIEKVVGDPIKTMKGKENAADVPDSRKMQQANLEGSPPVLPAQERARHEDPLKAVFPNLSPLDAGLLLMELDNVKRSQDTQSLYKADNVKYFNKRQASLDLAEIRARDAYGEDSDEEGLDNIATEVQEDNPS